MKFFILLTTVLLICGGLPCVAKEASVVGIYTNALGEELPYSIFSQKSWIPETNAHFVKLHLYFDESLKVKSLDVNTCGSKMNPEMSVFFNFDQWVMGPQSQRGEEVPKAHYPRKINDLLILDGFGKGIDVRSLTLNFEENSGFKICGILLKDPKGQVYNLKVPAVVSGKVQASVASDSAFVNNPLVLFDSRFDNAWLPKKEKNVHLKFTFDQPKKVEKIRLWNSTQRYTRSCYSRPKKVRVTGDGEYRAEISVKDQIGYQLITLPKAFEGKELKLEIIDAHRGKSLQELAISEIRFFDGNDWFLIDPTSKLRETVAFYRSQFARAKLEPLINDSYKANQEIKKDPFWITSKIRLRTDGSFYFSGYYGEGEGTEYFALGNYEVKEGDESKGLKLRLLGTLFQSAAYGDGDCSGCSRDCRQNEPGAESSKQKTFEETITVKRGTKGKFEISGEEGNKNINFKNLYFSREIWTL